MKLQGYVASRTSRAGLLLLVVSATSMVACDQLSDSPLNVLMSLNTAPDYLVTSLDTAHTGPLDDLATLSFHVTVQNIGDDDERPTAVSLYVDGEYVREVEVPGLKSLADTTVQLDWNAEAGEHKITVGVDHPAADTSFIAESDETNNLDSISVYIPYGLRALVGEDTLAFTDLPSTVLNDSLVQQVLILAADSGYSITSSTPMLRTRYIEGDITTFHIPLGTFSTPADSGALLTIVTDTLDAGATIPFITQISDTSAFVAYNSQGGVRFGQVNGTLEVSMLDAQSPSCTEGAIWGCVVQTGAAAIRACAASVQLRVKPHTPLAELASTLSKNGCSVNVLAFRRTKQTSRDNPPATYLSGFFGNECRACDGPDLFRWRPIGVVFTAEDDRGPVTYLTDRVWMSSCYGGSKSFGARDNAGQETWIHVTVDLPPNPLLRWPDHAYCHDQGGS